LKLFDAKFNKSINCGRRLVWATTPKDRTLDFHAHPDSDEVFFIVEGKMQLELKDKTLNLNTGDMCVVPKGVEHRPICTTEVICVVIEKQDTSTPGLTITR
jgi:mannose-6-phosphate isomerase-like protein (cupin superfamily)